MTPLKIPDHEDNDHVSAVVMFSILSFLIGIAMGLMQGALLWR